MQTVLFHSTIYGPIHSRRLGMSLGINLMPNDGKICSFDCLYCEAGFNAQGPGKDGVPSRDAVKKQLRAKLEEMKQQGQTLDVITFSGNGEPTIHPEFKKIVEDVLRLRTEYFPNAKVSVLSNSTMAGKPQVMQALLKVLATKQMSLVMTTHYDIEPGDARCLRVKGFENGEMDYQLVEVHDGEVPHEALNIAQSLGIDAESIDTARSLIDSATENRNSNH